MHYAAIEFSVMAFDRQLSHKPSKEPYLVNELVFESYEFFKCRLRGNYRRLVFMNQCTELLNALKDLSDELSDLSLFPSEHGLVQNLVKILIMDRD